MQTRELSARRRFVAELRRLLEEDTEEMWSFYGHRPEEVRECAVAALRAFGEDVALDGRCDEEAQ